MPVIRKGEISFTMTPACLRIRRCKDEEKGAQGVGCLGLFLTKIVSRCPLMRYQRDSEARLGHYGLLGSRGVSWSQAMKSPSWSTQGQEDKHLGQNSKLLAV